MTVIFYTPKNKKWKYFFLDFIVFKIIFIIIN
jgi:hypothetical protein